MNLIQLSKIVNTEEAATDFLKRINILKTFNVCIYCNSTPLYEVRRGHIVCSNCRREWGHKKHSLLGLFRITPQSFIVAVKCFSLGLTTSACAYECGMTVKTATKAYHLIRASLVPTDLTITFSKEILIHARYEAKKFNLILEDSINPSDLIIRILFTSSPPKRNRYRIKIEKWETSPNTPSMIKFEAANLIKQIQAHLTIHNNLSKKDITPIISEAFYRYNHMDEEIFSQTLRNIALSTVGR